MEMLFNHTAAAFSTDGWAVVWMVISNFLEKGSNENHSQEFPGSLVQKWDFKPDQTDEYLLTT